MRWSRFQYGGRVKAQTRSILSNSKAILLLIADKYQIWLSNADSTIRQTSSWAANQEPKEISIVLQLVVFEQLAISLLVRKLNKYMQELQLLYYESTYIQASEPHLNPLWLDKKRDYISVRESGIDRHVKFSVIIWHMKQLLIDHKIADAWFSIVDVSYRFSSNVRTKS